MRGLFWFFLLFSLTPTPLPVARFEFNNVPSGLHSDKVRWLVLFWNFWRGHIFVILIIFYQNKLMADVSIHKTSALTRYKHLLFLQMPFRLRYVMNNWCRNQQSTATGLRLLPALLLLSSEVLLLGLPLGKDTKAKREHEYEGATDRRLIYQQNWTGTSVDDCARKSNNWLDQWYAQSRKLRMHRKSSLVLSVQFPVKWRCCSVAKSRQRV